MLFTRFLDYYEFHLYITHISSSGRLTLNLERRLDHEGHPFAITTADAVAATGVPPWNWRDTPPGNGYCSFFLEDEDAAVAAVTAAMAAATAATETAAWSCVFWALQPLKQQRISGE
ncbi:hypothetical protein Patl1_06176 [Pistacia atlantica]|uniref:Uncharacterized protein n=1 Tax=Pistacia atlantica TaxID=434234 RepID=A0ACC1BTS6_9ROSI|nr:hypothetical protein Patl1_06176 [Pistacia atlantica]